MGWTEGRAGGLSGKNSGCRGRELREGLVCPGLREFHSGWSTECTGGGVARGRLGSWSVVRPQRPLCGISLRDLGCARGPGESVGQ